MGEGYGYCYFVWFELVILDNIFIILSNFLLTSSRSFTLLLYHIFLPKGGLSDVLSPPRSFPTSSTTANVAANSLTNETNRNNHDSYLSPVPNYARPLTEDDVKGGFRSSGKGNVMEGRMEEWGGR